MTPTPPVDLSPFAGRWLGEARCRRYLFDRPDDATPPMPVGEAAPVAPPQSWEEDAERRR